MSKEQQLFLVFYVLIWTVANLVFMLRLIFLSQRLDKEVSREHEYKSNVSIKIENLQKSLTALHQRTHSNYTECRLNKLKLEDLQKYLGVEYVTTPTKTELKKIKKG